MFNLNCAAIEKYVIIPFSMEWWQTNIISLLAIMGFLYISRFLNKPQINNFDVLGRILDDLSTQVLIYDVTVLEIEGENIKISLSHYGAESDLLSLLNIHENYKKINTLSQDIISFKYTTS